MAQQQWLDAPCGNAGREPDRDTGENIDREMHAEIDSRPADAQPEQAHRHARAARRAGERETGAEGEHQRRMIARKAVIGGVVQQRVPETGHERPRLEPQRAQRQIGELSEQRSQQHGEQARSPVVGATDPEPDQQCRRQDRRQSGQQPGDQQWRRAGRRRGVEQEKPIGVPGHGAARPPPAASAGHPARLACRRCAVSRRGKPNRDSDQTV